MRDAAREFCEEIAWKDRSVRRLTCRGGAATGLTVKSAGLIARSPEEGFTIAKRNPPLANRHAAIRLAFDAAKDRDNLVGGAFDLNDAVHQDLAGTVHGNEIGRAVAFAGDDDDPAVLQGYVRNQRVSDNQGRNPAGEFDKLGLIDIDHDGVSRELGDRGHRAQKNSKR